VLSSNLKYPFVSCFASARLSVCWGYCSPPSCCPPLREGRGWLWGETSRAARRGAGCWQGAGGDSARGEVAGQLRSAWGGCAGACGRLPGWALWPWAGASLLALPLTTRRTLRGWSVSGEGQRSWWRACSTSLYEERLRDLHLFSLEEAARRPYRSLQLPERSVVRGGWSLLSGNWW